MATYAFNDGFGDTWPPNTLAGGTITSRSATSMTYVSEAGYDITLVGTGLTYDADGMPSGGTLSSVTVAQGSVTFVSFAGISVGFGRAGMLLFGFDRGNGDHVDPDPGGFFQGMMRGDDLVTGSDGRDNIQAGLGNDTINAGGGDDYVLDQHGNDVMDGGDGWDALTYEEANSSWEPFRGVSLDVATGIALDPWGFTDHFSNFESFRDTSFGDTMKGSDAGEEFIINRGNDVVNGRGGFDQVSYGDATRWGAHHGITVNLATGVAIDSWKGTDTLTNVEGVQGTDFNDRLTGSARDERFLGGAGVDSINGAGGVDGLGFWIVGDNNTGGHGIVIDLTAAKAIVDDGYGNAEGIQGIEQFFGSRFADRLTGDADANAFWGDIDNDTLIGAAGADTLIGEWGNDRIFGGSGSDLIIGARDDDTLTGNAGQDDFDFDWTLADNGIDTITDFAVGSDELRFASVWGGGFTTDHLIANQFRSGAGVTTANTANQRMIYNTTTGDLYFDADGNGSGFSAVKIAVLSNHAALTFDDFFVML